jgi:hypothetical protein
MSVLDKLAQSVYVYGGRTRNDRMAKLAEATWRLLNGIRATRKPTRPRPVR